MPDMLSVGLGGWFTSEVGSLNPFSYDETPAAVVWPATLPDILVGASDETIPPVVASENEVGPSKVRRRATRERRHVSTSLQLTGAQRQTFEQFRLNLAATGERFQWESPDTDEIITCRVTKWPRWRLSVPARSTGERRWEGDIEVEVV